MSLPINPLSFITGNPLYLAIAAAVCVAIGFGLGWEVNGWRLGVKLEQCHSRVEGLTTQVGILSEKLDTQSESIDKAAEQGREALKAGDKFLEAARAITAKNAGVVDRLERSIAQGAAKREDGTAKDCGDARREIRTNRGKS